MNNLKQSPLYSLPSLGLKHQIRKVIINMNLVFIIAMY